MDQRRPKTKLQRECLLENNGKIFQVPCVTVTQEKWNSSIEKMKEIVAVQTT